MPATLKEIVPELAACADPERAELGLARLANAVPDALDRLRASARLRSVVVAVMAASPFLTRVCTTDLLALDVLSSLDQPLAELRPLSRWKQLELLRIAACDLGRDMALEAVGSALADLADRVLAAAASDSGLDGALSVVAMGKLGARELNYGSDVDVVLVAEDPVDARPLLDLARSAWRVDVALRPEGRSGPLVRTLASYRAYWDRWAQAWEFQALLKARAAAGRAELGQAFEAAAAERVWGRPLGADDLRSLRAMKARSEDVLAKRGLSQREIKLGPGGIRDIEFAVQLLQLVHGRDDDALRVRATLPALEALAAGGYVAGSDALGLAGAYRFLRAVEHRLQLFEDRQVHALPKSPAACNHLARALGYRDEPGATALAKFEAELARWQGLARGIHERLFFRPLLEAFTASRQQAWPADDTLAAEAGPFATAAVRGPTAEAGPVPTTILAAKAVSERLSAFGFSDARRTRDAVVELTQGFSRTSRLMRAMIPLVMDWLSEVPDPDLGLLGLRRLATGPHRKERLTALFRESPRAAKQLCLLLGTSPGFTSGFEHHPDQLALLGNGPPPVPSRRELEQRALQGLAWRARPSLWRGLSHFQQGVLLRAQARDVLGLADVAETEQSLTRLAEAVLALALAVAGGDLAAAGPSPAAVRALVDEGQAVLEDEHPGVPGLALVAMGRFGGAELSYASDLDVIFVFDDEQVQAERAEVVAEDLLKLINGVTPVQRLYQLDLRLRPEGRKGALARSLRAFEGYYQHRAEVWERQALLRGRFVAGDPVVGQRFGELARHFLWDEPLSGDEVQEIRRIKARVERERVPTGEDPAFHLKLGPGTLSDVEWTAQLLQLRHGLRAEGTLDALAALTAAGALSKPDASVLAESYRFCELTRNRLCLVRGRTGDSLPGAGHQLSVLARSLGTTAPGLRDEYRRLTRRARRVVERVFYGGD